MAEEGTPLSTAVSTERFTSPDLAGKRIGEIETETHKVWNGEATGITAIVFDDGTRLELKSVTAHEEDHGKTTVTFVEGKVVEGD